MRKISIIIPVYNTEEYIDDCIYSLCQQTYKDFEVLLINDGSNGVCKKKLENIASKDKRIKLYSMPKQKGVGAARNYGLKVSTGKYIYFMDSDDYLPEKTLEMLISNIGNLDIIRGKVKKVHSGNAMSIIFPGNFKRKIYQENKYNLIKNKSCLNFLIRRDYLTKIKVLFSEKFEKYTDLTFMIPVLNLTNRVGYIKEAVYFKQNRRDPIYNPSLSQVKDDNNFKDFLNIYIQLKEKYSCELINKYLDKQFLNLYRKDILVHFKEENKIGQIFPIIHDAVMLLWPSVLNQYDFILKREIRAIKSGSIKKYKRIYKRHNLLRELKKGVKSRRKFYTFLYNNLFMKMKMRSNLVVFESFSGKNYSDSPKYIYQYMIENKMDYKYIWVVNEFQSIPGNHKQVKRFSLSYFYFLARAKYWVSNARMPNFLEKRKDNIFLQTWHGTPLKRLAGDMDVVYMPGTNSEKYKNNFFNQTQKWDYLISPNKYSSDIFSRAFWFKGNMLEVGYPRNDILYLKDNKKEIYQLKEKLNLPLDKKIIMYAPTWRDDEFYSKGNYKFTLRLNLEEMQEHLGDEYIIILRMHYLIASDLDITPYKGFAYDFSNYNDISELYLISNLLITDYSSVFFDYANLKRPILFYTYDLEKYRDQLRGFYIDMEKELPGPLLMDSAEVLYAIKNIDEVQKKYNGRYEEFYNRFCQWDEGKASKETVERVFLQK